MTNFDALEIVTDRIPLTSFPTTYPSPEEDPCPQGRKL